MLDNNKLDVISNQSNRIINIFCALYSKFEHNEFTVKKIREFLPDFLDKNKYEDKVVSLLLYELTSSGLISRKESKLDKRQTDYWIPNFKDEFTHININNFINTFNELIDTKVVLILVFIKYLSDYYERETNKYTDSTKDVLSEAYQKLGDNLLHLYDKKNHKLYVWQDNFLESDKPDEIIEYIKKIYSLNSSYMSDLKSFIEALKDGFSENIYRIKFLLSILNNIDFTNADLEFSSSKADKIIINRLIELIKENNFSSVLFIAPENYSLLISFINCLYLEKNKTDLSITFQDTDKVKLAQVKILSLMTSHTKISVIEKDTLIDGIDKYYDLIMCEPRHNQKVSNELLKTYQEQITKYLITGIMPPLSNFEWFYPQIISMMSKKSLIVMDTKSLSRTMGKEKNIREQMVKDGLIKSITLIQGESDKSLSKVVLETNEPTKDKNQVIFINNTLAVSNISPRINVDFNTIKDNDFNLNPQHYISESFSKYLNDYEIPIDTESITKNKNQLLSNLNNLKGIEGVISKNISENILEDKLMSIFSETFQIEKFITLYQIVDKIKILPKSFKYKLDKNVVIEDKKAYVRRVNGKIIKNGIFDTSSINELPIISEDKNYEKYSINFGEILIDLSSGKACVIPEITDRLLLSEHFISITIYEDRYDKELLVNFINTQVRKLKSSHEDWNHEAKKFLEFTNLPVLSESESKIIRDNINNLNILLTYTNKFEYLINQLKYDLVTAIRLNS